MQGLGSCGQAFNLLTTSGKDHGRHFELPNLLTHTQRETRQETFHALQQARLAIAQ